MEIRKHANQAAVDLDKRESLAKECAHRRPRPGSLAEWQLLQMTEREELDEADAYYSRIDKAYAAERYGRY